MNVSLNFGFDIVGTETPESSHIQMYLNYFNSYALHCIMYKFTAIRLDCHIITEIFFHLSFHLTLNTFQFEHIDVSFLFRESVRWIRKRSTLLKKRWNCHGNFPKNDIQKKRKRVKSITAHEMVSVAFYTIRSGRMNIVE